MSNVIDLGSYLAENTVSADDVLKDAAGQLKQVLVLGFEADGTMYASANTRDKGTLVLLVEDFKMRLLNGEMYDE